nr:unnamed protein product [Spirometra erinaceieuropaei]
MNSQQPAPRSLPRTRVIRWRISPMQSTPQDSWPAVQLTTTRWASSVIDRLPTSIFRIDSRDGHDNSNDSVAANTVETARRASMPPCEGTFHLIPEQENSNDLVPVNQLPVSPSRGKPECEICLC